MEVTIYLLGLVISIVFAFICWKIATGKNRSGALWAVLGFFFPIIALIIILILKPKTPEAPATGSSF